MKHLFFCLIVIFFTHILYAQPGNSKKMINIGEVVHTIPPNGKQVTTKDVPVILIDPEATVHFVTPQDISYVDISSENAFGEIADKRLFKLKMRKGEDATGFFHVTLVTSNTITVYKVVPTTATHAQRAYVVTVAPEDSYKYSDQEVVSTSELKRMAEAIARKKRGIKHVRTRHYGIELSLRNINVNGDYLFFDIAAKNKTNIQYNLQSIVFKITDKNKVSSSISQELLVNPELSLMPIPEAPNPIIDKEYRNVFVFKKFTYPNEKSLQIEMTEAGISGRKVTINVSYQQLLGAEKIEL